MWFLIRAIMAGAALLCLNPARGEDFPARPVRFVTSDPGGSGDMVARMIAPGLTRSLGQQVIVDNRGANVVIPVVIKASPDGHTLLLYGSTFWIGTLLDKAPYDPLRDVAPIACVTSAYNVLVVHPAVPAHSVRELIDLARAKPGVLNYGSGATGASTHLGAELLKLVAGIEMLTVPYNGAGPAMQDLIAGTADLMFVAAAPAIPQIKAGRVRLIAVASLKRSPAFPDTQTFVDAGYANFAIGSDYGILAPTATPRPIVNRLNGALEKILATPEIRTTFAGMGVEPWWDTPEQYTNWIREEVEKWAAVTKAIKYQPE